MQLPAYNPARVQWDEFRRFHVKINEAITQFETGEVLFYWHTWKPDYRSGTRNHLHPECSLRIVSSADSDCPKLMLNDEALTPEVLAAFKAAGHKEDTLRSKPVPPAWLDVGGAQLLLIDSDGGRTIRYWRYRTAKDAWQHDAWDHVPTWVRALSRRDIAVYIPGHGAKAVGHKVGLSVPKIYTAEERKAYAALGTACQAWTALCDGRFLSVAPNYYEYEHRSSYRYKYARPMDKAKLPKGAETTLSDLLPEQRIQLSQHGYTAARVTVFVDSLTAISK